MVKMASRGESELDRKIVEAFKVRKLKITPQRIAIVKALNRMDHPTAEEIYEEVKKEQPYISLATVYRTLKLLINAGLVKELCLPDGVIRYDTNINPHINVVCVNCGRIFDVDIDHYVETFMDEIGKAVSGKGFRVVGFRFDVDVYCENCSIKNKQFESDSAFADEDI